MRRAVLWSAGALALAAGVVWLRPGTPANRAARRRLHSANRTAKYVGGQLHGAAYRARGGHPDPHVPDDVLADRVRSSLGTLEKRLDLPRVHVMVQKHVVSLHGSVGTRADADAIEQAVGAVSGVMGVDSHLHVGLTAGDCRPSRGRGVSADVEGMGTRPQEG